jgi:hypothetical protein
MASGVEEADYFELRFDDGRTIYVADNSYVAVQSGLALRGLLPEKRYSLGRDAGLTWFFWLFAAGIALVLYLFVGLAC